jgi:hypothetical protein
LWSLWQAGAGVFLRDAPGGKVIAALMEWLAVRDVLGRAGWVVARFLVIKP